MQQFSFNPAFLIDLIFTKEYLQIYTKEYHLLSGKLESMYHLLSDKLESMYHLLSDKFPLILICLRVNDIPF